MNYKRIDISELGSIKPIESKEVTLIWANDGWCYIPQLKMRQKFTETKFTIEEWEGIIGIPEYIETIIRYVYSKNPLVWREQGSQLDEVYSTK